MGGTDDGSLSYEHVGKPHSADTRNGIAGGFRREGGHQQGLDRRLRAGRELALRRRHPQDMLRHRRVRAVARDGECRARRRPAGHGGSRQRLSACGRVRERYAGTRRTAGILPALRAP